MSSNRFLFTAHNWYGQCLSTLYKSDVKCKELKLTFDWSMKPKTVYIEANCASHNNPYPDSEKFSNIAVCGKMVVTKIDNIAGPQIGINFFGVGKAHTLIKEVLKQPGFVERRSQKTCAVVWLKMRWKQLKWHFAPLLRTRSSRRILWKLTAALDCLPTTTRPTKFFNVHKWSFLRWFVTWVYTGQWAKKCILLQTFSIFLLSSTMNFR